MVRVGLVAENFPPSTDSEVVPYPSPISESLIRVPNPSP